MRCSSYSLKALSDADICVTDKPLAVNCTGIVSLDGCFGNDKLHKRNDFYLMYMIKGKLEILFGSNKGVLKSGDFIIISPQTYYKYRNTTGGEINYYWIHFSGTDAKKVIDELELNVNQITYVNVMDNIVRSFHRLFDEFVQPDKFHDMSCASLLITLLTRISRAAGGVSEGNNNGHLLYETLQYMNRHYNEQLSIPDLAEHAKISYGYFRRLFNEILGMSPSEYLTKLRMENASLLLYRTDISIKEIAYRVGFADQLYFTRVFTKFYGVSPSKFRTQHK